MFLPTIANVFLSASDAKQNPKTYKFFGFQIPHAVHVFVSILLFYIGASFGNMSFTWYQFCETEATVVGLRIAHEINAIVLLPALWWRTRNLTTHNANKHLESWASYRSSGIETSRRKRTISELLASGGFLLLFASVVMKYFDGWWFPACRPDGTSPCSLGRPQIINPWIRARFFMEPAMFLFTTTVYSCGRSTIVSFFLLRYISLVFVLVYVGVSFVLGHYSFFRKKAGGC